MVSDLTNGLRLKDKRIESLKALMILIICLYHASMSSARQIGSQLVISERIIFFFTSFMSYNLALFFTISGFLINCNFSNYLLLLKKRVFSLVVPYLFWNTIYIIIFLMIDFFSHGNIGKAAQLNLGSIKGIIMCLLGYPKPANGPLWYLRDMIILSILYPIIKYCVLKMKFFLILICFAWSTVCIFLKIHAFGIIDSYVFISFSLGIYLREFNYSIDSLCKNVTICLCSFILAVFLAFCYYHVRWESQYLFWLYAHLAAIPGWAYFIKKVDFLDSYRPFNFAKENAFLIYALHALCGASSLRLALFVFQLSTTRLHLTVLMSIYLIGMILIIVPLCVFLRSYFPQLRRLITGSR